MNHVPNELHEIFPTHAKLMHELKTADQHFIRLAERFHDVNDTIHRIEAGLEAGPDERLNALKHQRLAVLDEIAQLLERHRAA